MATSAKPSLSPLASFKRAIALRPGQLRPQKTREPLEPDEEPKAVRPARGGLTTPCLALTMLFHA